MSHGDIDSASKNLRGTLANVQVCLSPAVLRQLESNQLSQVSLFRIMDNIVRAGPKSREAVLALLGHVARANIKRGAMQTDSRVVSSHGFVVNLHNILLTFAAPFMDSTYSKVRRHYDGTLSVVRLSPGPHYRLTRSTH